jgi:hypothetical protein
MSETLAEKMARLHDLECEQAAMALLRERARRGDKEAKAQLASLKSNNPQGKPHD